MQRLVSASALRRSVQALRYSRSAVMPPRFSSGSDEAALAGQLNPLLSSPSRKWTLAADGEALERSFRFKTFAKTWDFMTAVSLQCKIHNHHPEWSNVYNTAFIRWTTHNPKGLSAKDIDMATACDAIAKDFGELDPETSTIDRTRDLADRAAVSAGNCCN